jgi:hypothetical protein
MAKKEINKPMSLVTTIVILRVGKEWENIDD